LLDFDRCTAVLAAHDPAARQEFERTVGIQLSWPLNGKPIFFRDQTLW